MNGQEKWLVEYTMEKVFRQEVTNLLIRSKSAQEIIDDC